MERTVIKTDILILGAGIGGYETFRTLAQALKRHGLSHKITIVDRNNYFTFVPLLHEVASGAVEPSQTAIPLHELVYGTPHQFIKASVEHIYPEKNTVVTSMGELTYDYCVIALGSSVNFFNVPGAQKYSFTIRTLTEAMRLRSELMEKLETCGSTLTVSIVGGGYTGVEVAGQLQQLIKGDLKKLYPSKQLLIQLIQTGPALAPTLPTPVQEIIRERLTKMGVKVILNSGVKEVNDGAVVLVDESTLQSDLTVWCTGFKGDADKFLDEKLCSKGRIPVTNTLTVSSFSNLYAVGDIILGHNPKSEVPFPQLGEAAHKEGEYVGKHIAATIRNKPLPAFQFKSIGTLMPIGDNYGLVVFKRFILTGWFAWWIRRTVYVAFMPGLLRKLRIVINWTLRLFGFSYILDIDK